MSLLDWIMAILCLWFAAGAITIALLNLFLHIHLEEREKICTRIQQRKP